MVRNELTYEGEQHVYLHLPSNVILASDYSEDLDGCSFDKLVRKSVGIFKILLSHSAHDSYQWKLNSKLHVIERASSAPSTTDVDNTTSSRKRSTMLHEVGDKLTIAKANDNHGHADNYQRQANQTDNEYSG